MLKLHFHNFWPGFPTHNNFFTEIFRQNDVPVVITTANDADIIFYSGDQTPPTTYHNCKKVFYTGENVWPNPNNGADLNLTFYPDDSTKQNIRLPLWLLYLNFDGVINFYDPNEAPAFRFSHKNLTEERQMLFKHKKMNFLYSNPAPESPRLLLFDLLDKRYGVTSGGRLRNNFEHVGGNELSKIQFMSQFQFTIACENSDGPGYVTEKILHAFCANTIPLYWGSDYALQDFNPEAFIYLPNFYDDKYNRWDEIALFRAIDNCNIDKMLAKPVFKNNTLPQDFTFPVLYKKITEALSI